MSQQESLVLRLEKKQKAKYANVHRHDGEHVVFEVNEVDIPNRPLFAEKEADVIHCRIGKAKIIDEGGHSFSGDKPQFSEGKMHGFIEAVVAAFSNHYPLALRPQHIWLLILQAVAVNVTENVEELRSKWVPHEGKKELIVLRNEFRFGKRNDWAGVILEDCRGDSFMNQIESCCIEGAYEDLMIDFSETNMIEKISMGITVMDTLQHYFKYIVRTRCGFPYILLEGDEEDWRILRDKAERLITNRCTESFATKWLPSLLPLLEKFYAEYVQAHNDALIDYQFWQSMCKRGGQRGSGGYNWLNGWFNILFPYLKTHQWNSFCTAYSPSADYVLEGIQSAPNMSEIVGVNESGLPCGISTAPVVWDYFGKEIPLTFHAGFICAKQDPTSFIITPHIGWYIVQRDEQPKSHS
jgi:hypothetical protein